MGDFGFHWLYFEFMLIYIYIYILNFYKGAGMNTLESRVFRKLTCDVSYHCLVWKIFFEKRWDNVLAVYYSCSPQVFFQKMMNNRFYPYSKKNDK